MQEVKELLSEDRQGEPVMMEQQSELQTGKKLYVECSLVK